MDTDAKLDQYLSLARQASAQDLVDVLVKATGESGLYAYGEFLDLDNVNQLQSSDHSPYYRLLELFAYGTWSDYKGAKDALPVLSPQQTVKLRQLTVATLAATRKIIPYSVLMSELDISSVRELEDFIIAECFYGGVLQGRMDQKERCMQVHDVVGRDLPKSQLPQLTEQLSQWVQRSAELLAALEEKMQYATTTSEQMVKHREEVEKAMEEMKRNFKTEVDLHSQEVVMDEGAVIDMMDEDRIGTRSKSRRR